MLRGLFLMLCALVLLAPAAVAADDEVFVDPGSPSGKEYALPVDRARQEAAGKPKGSDGKAATPLFGEGVDAASARTSSAKRSGSGAGTDEDDASAAGTAGGQTRATAPRTLKAQAAAPDGGIGVAAIIGGVSVGVLLLGGAIGVLLRRRAARSA